MSDERIDVIATTISGSIQDWKKVERIVPLFKERGVEDVRLAAVDSHAEARKKTREAVDDGARILISAGGSGTFNAVLEGSCDSGLALEEIRLGFLRKGSADLIGKVLGMPDDVEAAVTLFVDSIRAQRCVPCDVILAESDVDGIPARHFVGYGGAGIFGRIPHFTENRFMKWYKGVLSQFFGDLGPFTTGMALAVIESLVKRSFRGRKSWRIEVDGELAAEGAYHALIIVNGYLGKELPYSDAPLGSGRFYLFGIEDRGLGAFFTQIKHARAGTIVKDPDRWGMRTFTINDSLRLSPVKPAPFPVNVDGSTLHCREIATYRIVDRIRLISGE